MATQNLKPSSVWLWSRVLIIATTASILFACSHGLVVESDPDGASVVLNGKPVGNTPLTLDASALPQRGNLKIDLEKAGTGSVTTYLPNPIEIGSSQRVMVLIPKSEPETTKINRHVALVMRAHRLYLQKRTLEARNLLQEALLENPNYLYPHLLNGAIHFLNQEYEQAQTAYKRALEIDPDNTDSKRMLAILADKLGKGGDRLPAATGAPTSPLGRQR